MRTTARLILILLVIAGMSRAMQFPRAQAQDRLDESPINYHQTSGENPVRRLLDRLRSGETELIYERGFGQLKTILEELEVPVSSQCLVFSKTSLQAGRISPRNPRAIFFNDEVYVGWVHGSSLLEISTSDPVLGAAYYTIQMTPRGPYGRRENNRCLACHETTADQGRMPEHMVMSVMTRESGKVNLLLDEFVTDHSSPLNERWGGWYVTGDLGGAGHMGNAFLEGEKLRPLASKGNFRLADHLEIDRWPVQHSDVVALMVMEHQTQMHNRMTRANLLVRRAKHRSKNGGNSETENGEKHEGIDEVVDRASKMLLDHLLFEDELQLSTPVKGSGTFATEFAGRGPFTSDGRSLRQFDLQTRLFQFPCSYLVYSETFAGLDEELLSQTLVRLQDVLDGRDASEEYAHLSQTDRAAIGEILFETRNDLPAVWSRMLSKHGHEFGQQTLSSQTGLLSN